METEASQVYVEKRLETLSKWHEECRLLLNNRHKQQQENLETREGQKTGATNAMQTIDILYADESLEDINGLISSEEATHKSLTGQYSKPTSGYASESKMDTDSAQSIANTGKTNFNDDNKKNLAPRKFLRKGEGIKQRFKIEPDAFNLKKLPPYKYAKQHANLTKRTKRIPIQKKPIPQKVSEPQAAISLPPPLDAQEVRFQRLLFASKTVCNSTPDSKGSSIMSVEKSAPLREESHNMHISTTQSQESSSLDMAWAKVLDPYNIKPISVTKFREQTQSSLDDTEDENLNLFELLEEKAKEGSFNFNSSLIKKILAKNMATRAIDNDQNSDIIPISEEYLNAHIEPKVDKDNIVSSSESGDESEEECSEENSNSDSSESEDEDETENDLEQEVTLKDATPNDSTQKNAACLRVRFRDDESTLQSDTTKHLDYSSINVDNTALFEQMKTLVMATLAKNENPPENAPLGAAPLNVLEIKQLAEQGRQRVAELEKQIALFKETNLQLIKAKQQHEMEKVCFMQQHEEALEQINDEKVRIEIQLHDERMKLEQERRKLEEKSRMQKAAIANNERKEINKLKEEIQMLQNKLRDKEQNHTAAQARIRSQLRVYEKEQKHLYEEIERLSKENKKLEKQIAMHTRERNATMLQEINRNIVKLAGSTKNNSNTNGNNTEKPTKIEEKPTIARKPTAKKVAKSEEPLKTLKITASSFSHLFPQNIKEQSEENEQKIEEDLNSSDTMERHNQLKAALTHSPTSEKENSDDKSNSGFKVLTREIINDDGSKETIYPNGTIKKESADSLITRMMYFNGDVKETNVKEGTIKYYYAKTNTWHTTYLDGLEIIEFPNGQIEHRLPTGVIEVHYPHKNCIKIMDPNDAENVAVYMYDDGTKVCEKRNGNKLLTLPNGQKELTTKEFKRREYPDGTIKTVYLDGSHETRYSNGRLRLKDKDGNLIIDSELQDGKM